ncbi:helix-turn-helix domain-containing protein [Flavobacterium sp. JP2137]|uniref:helix-turn-helix domain-containing protein n=1 Tax=Flavobacterium sp. JP2137 TaxID=3414510 RepID=UPI003D30136E
MKPLKHFLPPLLLCCFLVLITFISPVWRLTAKCILGLIYGPLFYLAFRYFLKIKGSDNGLLHCGAVALTVLSYGLLSRDTSELLSLLSIATYSLLTVKLYRANADKVRPLVFHFLLSFNLLLVLLFLLLIVNQFFSLGVELPVSILVYVLSLTVILLLGFALFYGLPTAQTAVWETAAPKHGEVAKEFEEVVAVLDTHFEASACYLDANLNIVALAKELQLSRTAISTALNQGLKMNFYQYMAAYRIEYAKKRIVENEHFTMEGLSFECGFNSKSSFNRYFKTTVGTTPSQYKCFKTLADV